jgi:hypothetical protein
MTALPPSILRRIVPASVLAGIALTGACIDRNPVVPLDGPSPALTSELLEALGDLPPFIEIAQEVSTFGGFWFNQQDQVVVGLTDLADFQRVVAMIPRYLGAHQPTGGYVAMEVRHSFADLARYRAALRAPVFRDTRVVSLGVNESANRVEVGIRNRDVESEVRGLARTLGIPDDAVAIREVPVAQLTTHTLRSAHPAGAIEGGWEIGPRICTLGFPAIRQSNGSSVFVINSHCTDSTYRFDGGPVTQPLNGAFVGSEALDPPGWTCLHNLTYTTCRNSDPLPVSGARG